MKISKNKKKGSLKYFVRNNSGHKLDVSPWIMFIKDNIKNRFYNLFALTPIMQKANGNYLWCIDSWKYRDLNKKSVNALIRNLKNEENKN
jgi:hypothetical protein